MTNLLLSLGWVVLLAGPLGVEPRIFGCLFGTNRRPTPYPIRPRARVHSIGADLRIRATEVVGGSVKTFRNHVAALKEPADFGGQLGAGRGSEASDRCVGYKRGST